LVLAQAGVVGSLAAAEVSAGYALGSASRQLTGEKRSRGGCNGCSEDGKSEAHGEEIKKGMEGLSKKVGETQKDE
jgi:hypothetical protein